MGRDPAAVRDDADGVRAHRARPSEAEAASDRTGSAMTHRRCGYSHRKEHAELV
ncbi:MAG TPA: hypothetical protein PLU21_01990 [Candidatus Saccharibacteria bacterium]|nr:hypothetical protein [Candidatus Saccharibacteria bacterium]